MLLAQGMELFAQVGNDAGNANAAQGPDARVMMGVLCFYGVAIAVAIIIQCFFLNTLSKCFKEIAPRNRSMEPGHVWLCLIPLFGIVWIIITILRLAESLEKEYRSRGLSGDGDFGKQSGLIYIISSFICGCVAIVFWIIYWMKISAYTKELRAAGGSRERDDLDDDDDRPRRRRREEEPDEDADDFRPRDRG